MKRLELEIVNGELAGRRFAVGAGGLRFGRSSSNDVHVPDEELSRNHCLFEPSGECGVRVTDLASANGTFVNGAQLGAETVELNDGDVINAGSVEIRVVGERPAVTGGSVDLGLGTVAAPSPAAPAAVKTPRRSNLPWLAAAVIIVAAIAFVLTRDPGESDAAAPAVAPVQKAPAKAADAPRLVEMSYEKVEADSRRIFRHAMKFADGELSVSVDDLPDEDRHLAKSVKLSKSAGERLEEILSDPEIQSLESEYVGPGKDTGTFKSRVLRLVWSDRAKTIRCRNVVEPDAFVRLRDKLEAFSKNELGIWAMGHSKAELLELAAVSAEIGAAKWEDRDVEHGNVFAAVRAYKEALFYLESINPKPGCFEDYRKALKECETELESRYRDHRFKANRASNVSDWETAQRELQTLIAIIPDRDDDRYREASQKLMDVSRRLDKGGR